MISVCSSSHADVWGLTSRLLPEFVQASNFTVYVPVNEVKLFQKIGGPLVSVQSQESLDTGFVGALQEVVMKSENSQRYGWYLQQFFKIQALIIAEESRVAIWDADCVPIRPTELFDAEGLPIYMIADEHNEDYFAMIERLTGLRKIQNHSFVTPGFPILSDWVSDFKNLLEGGPDGRQWWERLIEATDFSLKAGFSETETLGTWVANSYPGQWTLSEPRWERRGQSRFGYARNFSPERLVELGRANELDIISFENWDFRRSQRAIRRLKQMLNFPTRVGRA